MRGPPDPEMRRAALADGPISQSQLPCTADTTSAPILTQAEARRRARINFGNDLPHLPAGTSQRFNPLVEVRMSGHATELAAKAEDQDAHVLSVLRLVSVRLGLIRDEINDIGIALKNGRIAPEYARMLADRVAPGCYEAASEDIIQ